jgi:1-acylglycerone phosphate reductase
VVNIISGEVATNILKHDRGRKLPEGSLYTVLADEFGGHVDRTPSESYPRCRRPGHSGLGRAWA